MNNALSFFTPPKGTTVTITHFMTCAERKHEGRKRYAKYITYELLELNHWADITHIKAKANRTKITLSFDCYRATIKFQYTDNSLARELIVCPLYDKGDGAYSLEKWLTKQDPCLGARLLKNARKQLRDNKSREGVKKKQAYVQPHSPMEIDEFI